MSELSAIAPVQSSPPFLIAQNDQVGASGSLLVSPQGAPPTGDVVRFEGLLAAPVQEAPPAATAPPVVRDGGGIGDLILEGIDRMSVSYQSKVDAVNTTINSGGPEGFDSGSIMQLQFELAQMTLMQDLTAKVADKASQGIQTLFKNQ